MLRLIIDTSLGYMGIGLAEDAEILVSTLILKPATVTTVGIKTIDFLLNLTRHKIDQLNELVVSSGPGTFTSLRVGISIAKGIAMGLGIPLIPVSTLNAMALTFQHYHGIIVPIIDGKNNNLYLSEYLSIHNTIKSLSPEIVVKVDNIKKRKQGISINLKYHRSVFIVSFGIDKYKNFINKLYNKIEVIEPLNINNMLNALNNIAYKKLFNVKPVSAEKYTPTYLREPDIKIKALIKNFINA